MRLFRQTYKVKGDEEPRKSSKWYIEPRDLTGRLRRLPAFTDKRRSEEFGRLIERFTCSHGRDRELARVELLRTLETMPTELRAKLAKLRLIDEAAALGALTLDELLDRFRESLEAESRTKKHVRLTVGRVRRAFRACSFRAWSDLNAHELAVHLHHQRQAGLARKTSNHIGAACRQFTAWALCAGVGLTDPLATLKPLNAREDLRRERRALDWDLEVPALIQAAASGPTFRRIPGPVRAAVWSLLLETGLRVAEMQSLRAGDFELCAAAPTVTVRAATTKNRREARKALRPRLAADLAWLLRDRLPAAPAFELPHWFKDKATLWLRHDLARACIPYRDELGRVVDVHALRATYVDGLMRAGVPVHVVQHMARHSSSAMTVEHYSKLRRDDHTQAMGRLPELPPIFDLEAGGGDHWAPSWAVGCAETRSRVQLSAGRNPTDGPGKADEGAGTGGGGGNRTRRLSALAAAPSLATATACELAPLERGGPLGAPLGAPAGATEARRLARVLEAAQRAPLGVVRFLARAFHLEGDELVRERLVYALRRGWNELEVEVRAGVERFLCGAGGER